MEWPDFKFPPINLLVLPRHEVLLEAIGRYYAEQYGFLWEDFKEKYDERDLSIVIRVDNNV